MSGGGDDREKPRKLFVVLGGFAAVVAVTSGIVTIKDSSLFRTNEAPSSPPSASVSSTGSSSEVTPVPEDVPTSIGAEADVTPTASSPASVWLSDMKPITTSGEGYDDKAVVFRGQTYVHSISLLPRSFDGDNWLLYALNGQKKRLTGLAGIEDGDRAKAGAVFEIETDGVVVWSEQVNVAEEPAVIDVSLDGVQDLKISVVGTCECAYWSNSAFANVRLE